MKKIEKLGYPTFEVDMIYKINEIIDRIRELESSNKGKKNGKE